MIPDELTVQTTSAASGYVRQVGFAGGDLRGRVRAAKRAAVAYAYGTVGGRPART